VADYLRVAASKASVVAPPRAFGFHTFRRTLASVLVKMRVDVKTVQEILRHQNLKTTLEMYAKSMSEDRLKAQGMFLELLFSHRRTKSIPGRPWPIGCAGPPGEGPRCIREQPQCRSCWVCERWIYSAGLCFALDLEEQERSGFRYQYSNFQLEYSRNLVFDLGGQMEQVFQALIDRSRARLNLKTIKTILGYRHRPKYHKRKGLQWEVAVERPTYDLTIFKLHCGNLTLKIYTKGERVLRIEAMAHDVAELDCGRSLEKFPEIVSALKSMLERFMNALSCIDQCFIADETLEHLPAPTQIGKTKVGGIDFNKPRMRWVAQAVITLSPFSSGFTASKLAQQVRTLSQQSESDYGPRRAAYDLKKLRGKQLVRRMGKTAKYQPIPAGLRAMVALLLLRDQAIKPLLVAAQQIRPTRGPQNPRPLDSHYQTICAGMQGVFQELGIAA